MTARLAPKTQDRRRPPPSVDRADRQTESKPAPLIKPTGPLIYTVSKGADVFPTGRQLRSNGPE